MLQSILDEDYFYGRQIVAETYRNYLYLRTQSYFVERLAIMYQDTLAADVKYRLVFSKE